MQPAAAPTWATRVVRGVPIAAGAALVCAQALFLPPPPASARFAAALWALLPPLLCLYSHFVVRGQVRTRRERQPPWDLGRSVAEWARLGQTRQLLGVWAAAAAVAAGRHWAQPGWSDGSSAAPEGWLYAAGGALGGSFYLFRFCIADGTEVTCDNCRHSWRLWLAVALLLPGLAVLATTLVYALLQPPLRALFLGGAGALLLHAALGVGLAPVPRPPVHLHHRVWAQWLLVLFAGWWVPPEVAWAPQLNAAGSLAWGFLVGVAVDGAMIWGGGPDLLPW